MNTYSDNKLASVQGKQSTEDEAKAVIEVGKRIGEAARLNDIPVVEDPSLLALLSLVPLQQEMPDNLISGIAEVISYIDDAHEEVVSKKRLT